MMPSAVRLSIPGTVAIRSRCRAKGAFPPVDLDRQTPDRLVQIVQFGQDFPFRSGRDGRKNRPRSASRRAGIFLRNTPLARSAITSPVPAAADQGGEHCPAGDAEVVGGDRGELDAGVLEDLVQALGLAGPFLDLGLAVPGQVPQLADRLRGHERGLDEPVGDQLGNPRGVGHVRLTTRDIAQGLRR